MCKVPCFILTLLTITANLTQSYEISLRECPFLYEEPCDTDHVKFFYLTNRKNRTFFREFTSKTLPKDLIQTSTQLKIAIHGYGGLQHDYAIKNVSAAYLNVGQDVILVDWGPLARVPCYATAYLNTFHVGKCVALLAASFLPLGIHPSALHLVGFSLGAHIAGFVGSHLKAADSTLKPGRITGLDPALPFFATLNNEWKLDQSDAEFVDVVHTSAGVFGKIEAVGHADFYVNGGTLQPVCETAPYPPLCSHAMAGVYFAESITSPTKFSGVQCENLLNYILGFCHGRATAAMGEFVSKKSRGSYFVVTANSPPYALGFAR